LLMQQLLRPQIPCSKQAYQVSKSLRGHKV
jgi:hypothetical protein